MPIKNAAVTVNIVCWDTANNVGKTGDALNITLRGVRDGTLFTPSAPSITQVDSTNLPGVYKASLTASENNGTFLTLGGKSSSTGCVIIPVSWSNELTGDAFARLGATAGASVSADIAAVKSDTGATLADTNELQTDLTNGGRLDLLIDAIKAKSDNLPASPAAVGSAMTLTSAYDAAKTAASQTSVNAIPTNPLLTNDARLDNLDAAISSRSTLTAAQVWANSTRTLSSFGTLVSDIATAVWGSAARTLTAISDSAGVTTLLSRIGAALTITGGKVDVNDKTGFALTSGERTAIANEVEAQIIDDTDSEKVLQAIVDKIAAVNPSLGDLTLATIASAIRTELATELGRIDAAVSTRLATSGYTAPANADIAVIKAKTDNLPASPAAVGSAMTLTSAYDAAKTAASQTSVNAIPTNPLLTNDARLNNLDAAISSRSSQTSVDTVDGIVDDILIDTAVIGAAGAGLTAIPWNAAWDAEVQSECTDALNAYDPPTNAEMEARTLAFADYATATNLATVDTVVDAVKAVTDKLDTALELDGAVYRYTENALEQAPSGSGLDAAGVRAAIGLASANLDTQLDALPTAAENADAVLDELLSEHTDVGSAGAGIAAAGSSGDPWATALPGAYAEGTAGNIIGTLSTPGSGAILRVYSLTESTSGNPIVGATVTVTTDIAGTVVVASGTTDSGGRVEFYLDAGTYYLWRSCTGYTFADPDTEVFV